MTILRIPEGAVLAIVATYPHGASQRQISGALGVAPETVRAWEREAFAAFRASAEALGIDVLNLLRFADARGLAYPCDRAELEGGRAAAEYPAMEVEPSALSQRVEAALLEAECAVERLQWINESEAA